jgi:hypothetical protein
MMKPSHCRAPQLRMYTVYASIMNTARHANACRFARPPCRGRRAARKLNTMPRTPNVLRSRGICCLHIELYDQSGCCYPSCMDLAVKFSARKRFVGLECFSRGVRLPDSTATLSGGAQAPACVRRSGTMLPGMHLPRTTSVIYSAYSNTHTVYFGVKAVAEKVQSLQKRRPARRRLTRLRKNALQPCQVCLSFHSIQEKLTCLG